MPFNHAYTIAFSLISEKEDASDVTPAMLSAALRKRADDLDASTYPGQTEKGGEWIEAVGAPYDTYEEEGEGSENADDCAHGIHSWVDAVGKLPADTACANCGELYGDPK